MTIIRETELGGRPLKFILGRMAKQADGAAWVQYGDTVLLTTVVASHDRTAGSDFLPLTVEYREKFYAAGKIPGGFFKREGRPHENEILNARIIDRPIRPLFPDGFTYETQVIAFVLSSDKENDASTLGPVAASLALNLSDIPMNEVIGSVRVGMIDNEFIVNPTYEQQEKSRLDLMIVGSDDAITMVEGHCDEFTNQELIEALAFGHDQIKKIVEFQKDIVRELRKPEREFEVPQEDVELLQKIQAESVEDIKRIANETDKSKRKQLSKDLEKKFLETVDKDDPDAILSVKAKLKEMLKHEVRTNILRDNKRLDGRTDRDIREITCELGVLPRAHGSALFTRGQTQALGSVTLGTKLDEQRVDQLDVDGFRQYMLHYNFPPFCTGEIKRAMNVSRREVGHGKLGERALEPMIPDFGTFPYTIRVVSDIMESNGSSSMATVCAGSLAMMDAGIPLKKAVAGIAMGLIKEGDDYRILTDILGDEDHLGDMDFKVAGTRDGITAFQMDIKIKGISAELMAEALEHAEDARNRILDTMAQTISEARPQLSPFAPKFIVMKIPSDCIGAVIGPGGKMIREIISVTGATIDIEDDGTVRIGAADQKSANDAKARIEALTERPEAGKVYMGTIKRIMPYGAFVEILPGVEGLLHISQIEHRRIERVEDVFEAGDNVEVKLLKIDPSGKLDLSRKVLLPGGPPDDGDGFRDRGGPPRGNRGRGGGNRGPRR